MLVKVVEEVVVEAYLQREEEQRRKGRIIEGVPILGSLIRGVNLKMESAIIVRN